MTKETNKIDENSMNSFIAFVVEYVKLEISTLLRLGELVSIIGCDDIGEGIKLDLALLSPLVHPLAFGKNPAHS